MSPTPPTADVNCFDLVHEAAEFRQSVGQGLDDARWQEAVAQAIRDFDRLHGDLLRAQLVAAVNSAATPTRVPALGHGAEAAQSTSRTAASGAGRQSGSLDPEPPDVDSLPSDLRAYLDAPRVREGSSPSSPAGMRPDAGPAGSLERVPALRLRGGGPDAAEPKHDIVENWITESGRIWKVRSGKLQEIDRTVEAWVTGGRDHPLAFGENRQELEAIQSAIRAWQAEPHGSTRTAAVERLQERVRHELATSDRLSRTFPHLTASGYLTSQEERASFRSGYGDYELHRRQIPPGGHLKRIPEEDLVALIAYTGITEFAAVNQALRTGDRGSLAAYTPLIKGSMSALNKLPAHVGTVYRGISLDEGATRTALLRYAPGRVVQEPAFVSTNAFAPRFSGNIQFEIASQSGRSVQMLSRHKGSENEVIFAPGTIFKVQSVQRREDIWNISMAEVSPAGVSQHTTASATSSGQATSLLWTDASGWRKTGSQLGSNPGGIFEDPSGRRYYLKLAQSPDHARNEVLAAVLYRLTGIDVPQLHLITFESKHGTASHFIEDARQDLKQSLKIPSYRKAIYSGYAVDAWLANWDVAGRHYDNIVNTGGRPMRIDTGGALLHSGRGGSKGNYFASTVTEWKNLRNYSINPQTFEVFQHITTKEMQESARRVLAVTPEQIDAAVDSVGFGGRTAEFLKTTLKERRVDVARLAGLPLPADAVARTEHAAPAAAPAQPPQFAPARHAGPQARPTASQMLAMVNRQPDGSHDRDATTGTHVGWGEPMAGADAGERAIGSGFGAAIGFAGVDVTSRAMEVARGLIDVPEEVAQPVAARAEAARLVGLLLHDPLVADQVAGSGVRVVVIPRSRRVVDLPPYASMQGEGGPPAGARGWTDPRRALVAVSEENLLGQEATETGRTHTEGYSSVLHEGAHLVYAFGLSSSQRADVERLFSTRQNAGPTQLWVDGPLRDLAGSPALNHSSANAAEYFAQSTVSYFGANHGRDAHTNQRRNNGPAWLAANDPDLYLLFRDLFGSPPPGPLDANALSVTAADQAMWDALNWHTGSTEPEEQGREGRWPQSVTHPPTAGVQHRTEFGIDTIAEPDPAAASGLADTSPDQWIDIAGMTGAGAIDDYFRDEAPGHITLANSDVILHLPDGDQERWLPVAQEIANRLPHRIRVPLAGLQGGMIELCPEKEPADETAAQ